MVDPNTRQGKRTPVTLKIKFKSETIQQFIERYAVDVSQGGIFIRTKEPLAVGTQMKFEFQLRDASPLIAGEGTVVWTRENDPSRPAIAPGMGVRFDRLADGSQTVLERILAEKLKQAPHRGQTDQTTKPPPMFADSPTRVAPMPVQEALLGDRKRRDSEQTPLPKPMPFHSDAEDFDEHAFEEATKVRSLDELVAETARHDDPTSPTTKTATAVMPPDELALRRGPGRADSTLADPPAPESAAAPTTKSVPDRDSAPGLPSPPDAAPARPGGKLLDTSPSPRSAAAAEPVTPEADHAKTRLGFEPAKAPKRDRDAARRASQSAAPRAIPADPSRPYAPKRPGSAPVIIAVTVFVAAAIAGVWFFFVRDSVGDDATAEARQPDTGSAGTPQPGSAAEGSAGTTMTGSASAAPAVMVDTVIPSSVAKAKIEVVGTDQAGTAPFTAKLEQDKPYKVRVTAPGYAALDLDVIGGHEVAAAKLVGKPHVVSVASDPDGAMISIDNVATGKLTPANIELTAAQAAKPRFHVTIRKAGYRPVDQIVEATAFTETDAALAAKVTTRLAVTVQLGPRPNGSGSTTPPKPGSGSGSAAPTSSGSGAEPPTPGVGSGSATAPSPTGSSATKPATGSGAEPEPDWSKHAPPP